MLSKMKIIKKIALIGLLFIVNNASAQRPDFLKKDSIKARLDGNIQVFYYDKSTVSTLQPQH